MTYIYAGPFMFCDGCQSDIPLPYPDLPQISDEQWTSAEFDGPTDSVPDKWSMLFGCRKCGNISGYEGWRVGDKPLHRENHGRFDNDANCFSVTLQCARLNCKAPAILHTNMHADEEGKDFVRLLRGSFFVGKLPCGHDIMPIPERLYRDVHRVMKRLW